MVEKIQETAQFLSRIFPEKPVAGVVLGTGLNALTEHIEDPVTVSYADIPGFPLATVEFHKGRFLFGRIAGKIVAVMQGRFHYYEGYTMQEVTFPIRVLKWLGARYLFLSNAAGGISSDLKKGDLVVIEDHINLLPENPLRGKNDDRIGSRFPDMSAPYAPALNEILRHAARAHSIELKKGIYASVQGPNLETRAEYRFLRTIGADMVGMSTVPEVIVANHMQLPCAAVSVITDECDPDNLQPVNIEEIVATASRADPRLALVLKTAIGQLV